MIRALAGGAIVAFGVLVAYFLGAGYFPAISPRPPWHAPFAIAILALAVFAAVRVMRHRT